jgi:hypothetical protein
VTKDSKKWNIVEGEVVRMRSVALDQQKGMSDNILFLNPRSNIMRFLSVSKIAREIENEVGEEEKILKMMLCEEEKCILDSPKIISTVSDNLKSMKFTNLFDIFHKQNESIVYADRLRVKFYVLNIQPYDP